jgi:hypothetical protein
MEIGRSNKMVAVPGVANCAVDKHENRFQIFVLKTGPTVSPTTGDIFFHRMRSFIAL